MRTPRRGAPRTKRPRKPLPGMMLHQGGSTPGRVPDCQLDVRVTRDEATTVIDSAFFVEEEGTLSRFRGLRGVRLTQGHCAWAHGRIPWIPASSPEARGRSERVCRTLQDRLPNELALAGIPERAAATRSLAERVLPADHPRVAVLAPEVGTAALPWIGHDPRRDSLCAGRAGRGQGPHRAVSCGIRGRVCRSPRIPIASMRSRSPGESTTNGTLAVLNGPRCLARSRASCLANQPRPQPLSGGRCLTRPAARLSIVDQR